MLSKNNSRTSISEIKPQKDGAMSRNLFPENQDHGTLGWQRPISTEKRTEETTRPNIGRLLNYETALSRKTWFGYLQISRNKPIAHRTSLMAQWFRWAASAGAPACDNWFHLMLCVAHGTGQPPPWVNSLTFDKASSEEAPRWLAVTLL